MRGAKSNGAIGEPGGYRAFHRCPSNSPALALKSLSGFSPPEKNPLSICRGSKNKCHLTDSEAVLMLEHSVTKDTVAQEADTVELCLFQGRVVEVLMDMGMLGAEKMG